VGEGIPWGTVITVATTVGGYLLAFVLIPRILLQQREAAASLAWIMIIAFVPYLGALLFFLIGRRRIRRRTRKRLRARNVFDKATDQLPYQDPDCPVVVPEPKLSGISKEIAKVASYVSENKPLSGNQVEVYIETNRAYDRMEAAILEAQHHIHMMSYIFRSDQAGKRFRDLLADKARQGVEVRLLVDAVGSHQLETDFIRVLEEAGGHYAAFMPVFPLRGHWRPNLRNHRKILIADGRVGFAGGLNIGDEYQGRKKRFAPWRDTHMRVEGPAAWRLQEIFAEDWFYTTGQDLVDPGHFPQIQPVGDDVVQVVESGPDQPHENIHAVFFTAISEAKNSIYITTPYFVPDRAVLTALKAAAWKGVDVRILVPGKSDHGLIRLAGNSFHRELVQAGVKLYEHRPGMLHAKTMVVDGRWSTVGSANMDIRSFRLNFEVNLLVSGERFAASMEDIFMADIAKARVITKEALDNKSGLVRFGEAVSRVLSPVL